MPNNKSSRPQNPYELVGLIKGLNTPEMRKVALHLRQQILINILLAFINNGAVTKECFAAGFESLSVELKSNIGIGTADPNSRPR